MSGLHEECGVFGIYDVDGFEPAQVVYYGLYALQHRGQESCGIAVNDDGTIVYHKDMGLVSDVFNDVILNHLKGGTIGVGHVRYSTTGASERENAQPLVSKYVKGTLTVAHNGNLVNSQKLRKELEESGAILQTTNDSEVIAFTLAKERIKTHSIEEAVLNSMDILRGSYALVVMSPRKLIGARDPYGIRPLCLGKLKNSYILASESCALDAVDATFIREIEPGEVVVIEGDKLTSLHYKKSEKNICIFEYIYFARPDSVIEGVSVHHARREAGRFLAQEHPVDADVVIGVPDSGLAAAQGYAEYSGIPYEDGFIKNRYIGRTFIQPEQHMREVSVRIKLNVLKKNIEGKRVVMVDDSIVRGTTCSRIVKMLKDAGAKEVHVRISSPPFLWPCYFGTDISSTADLAARNFTHEEIVKMLGADSLGYMTTEGLNRMVDGKFHFCDGCFSGKYPMDINPE